MDGYLACFHIFPVINQTNEHLCPLPFFKLKYVLSLCLFNPCMSWLVGLPEVFQILTEGHRWWLGQRQTDCVVCCLKEDFWERKAVISVMILGKLGLSCPGHQRYRRSPGLNPHLKQMLDLRIQFDPRLLSDHVWGLGSSSEAGNGKWIKISRESSVNG